QIEAKRAKARASIACDILTMGNMSTERLGREVDAPSVVELRDLGNELRKLWASLPRRIQDDMRTDRWPAAALLSRILSPFDWPEKGVAEPALQEQQRAADRALRWLKELYEKESTWRDDYSDYRQFYEHAARQVDLDR